MLRSDLLPDDKILALSKFKALILQMTNLMLMELETSNLPSVGFKTLEK